MESPKYKESEKLKNYSISITMEIYAALKNYSY